MSNAIFRISNSKVSVYLLSSLKLLAKNLRDGIKNFTMFKNYVSYRKAGCSALFEEKKGCKFPLKSRKQHLSVNLHIVSLT